MSSPEPTRVLVVMGDPELSLTTQAALTHPRLLVQIAANEQDVVKALTTAQFDVVVVGGHIGKRGPLVLCDVVRLRQPQALVLVLLHGELDSQQLCDHRERSLPGVHYLDLRAASPGDDLGAEVRAAALRILNIDEDELCARRVKEELARLRAGDGGLSEDEVMDGEEVGFAVEVAAPEGNDAAITEDDLSFVARMIARTRGVDFRGTQTSTQAPEGTDRATAKLRDRVRELERYVARVCHVYAARQHDFDHAAERVTKAEEAAAAAARELFGERERRAQKEEQLEAIGRRAELAEARQRELDAECARLREELGTKDATYTAVLTQAQEAFTQLREQSAQTLAFYERRAGEQDLQIKENQQELAKLLERELQGAEKLAELLPRLEEDATLRGKLAELTERFAEVRGAAEAAELRVRELEPELVARAAELARAVAAQDELTAQNEAARAEEQQARAAAVEAVEQKLTLAQAALAERTTELAECQRELTTLLAHAQDLEQDHARLTQELEIAAKDKSRWEKLESDLQDEIHRAKERGLESALDARLMAIEEHTRLATESFARYGEAVSALDQRTAKQANLVDRMARMLEAPEGRREGGIEGPLPSVEAARLLAERMRPEKSAGKKWLRVLRRPWVLGLSLLALCLASVLVIFSGSRAAPDEGVEEAETKAAEGSETPPPPEPKEAAQEPAAPLEGDEAETEAKAAVDDAPAPPADDAQAAPAPLGKEERRELRSKFFELYKAKKWEEALAAGERLRASGKIDWETELNLARALRSAGREEEAIAAFKAFVAAYPKNKYAAEAKAASESKKK